jgi:hypothetical protein
VNAERGRRGLALVTDDEDDADAKVQLRIGFSASLNKAAVVDMRCAGVYSKERR